MTYPLENYLADIRYDRAFIFQDIIFAGGSSGRDIFLEWNGHQVLPVGIRLPFTWTSCTCFFSGSTPPQQGQYHLYLENELYTISSSLNADVYIALNPLVFLGFWRVRLECGLPGAPVTQTAQRQVEWHLRRTEP